MLKNCIKISLYRFIARGIDVHKRLPELLKAAYRHKGAAFVEIYQNCVVYNDDVFAPFTDKANAPTAQIWVEHGKPLLFSGGAKGLKLNVVNLHFEIVDVVDGDWEAGGVTLHDQTNRSLAHMLVEMPLVGFPVALGVIFDDPRPTFEGAVIEQNNAAAKGKSPDLQQLIEQAQTWTIGADGNAH